MTREEELVRRFVIASSFYKLALFAPPHLAHAANASHAVLRRTSLAFLPLELPQTIAALRDVLSDGYSPPDLSPVEKLSLLLRYTCSPLRWEPDNPYKIHRGIASPRSVFLCELTLVLPGEGDAATVARYHPAHHALELLHAFEFQPTARDASLLLTARFSKCIGTYGSFAPVLAALEGGIVLAQLALLARALGLSVQVEEHAGVCDLAGATGFTHWSDMPLARVTLAGLTVSAPDLLPRRRPVTVADSADPYASCEDFPEARELAIALQVERVRRRPAARPPGRISDIANISQMDVCEMIRRRTSANDIDGLAPCATKFDAACLRGLLASWRALSEAGLEGCEDPIPCAVYLVVLICRDGEPGLYRIDGDEPARLLRAADFAPLFHEALTLAYGYNMRQFNVVALVCADYAAHLEEIGPRAFLRIQHEAGRRLHQFCLAAATHGMFARPIKMYREAVLECGLALEGQLVFAALAGFARRVNMAFELL